MVNPSDLWIGDKVRAINSGRTGSFEGIKDDGRLRIKSGGKIYLFKPEMLEHIKEKPFKKVYNTESDEVVSLQPEKIERTIDLHIEKLNKNFINALPERIFDIQIKAFERYMEKSVEVNFPSVVIIHGRGKGELKNAIEVSLKSMDKVEKFEIIHNGGATKVYFR